MIKNTTLGASGVLSIVLAACGTTTTTSAPSTTAASVPTVTTLITSKTAQMVLSGQDATFTITALSKSGAPVPSAPVSFYLGTMVPLSGVGVKTWNKTGTTAAAPYVVSASSVTDANGKATLVLKGQPNDTMEMIGVSVGTLSTYSATKGAIGSMDAWWTTPGSTPTAPVGDYVTVSPFATITTNASQNLTISVSSPQGQVSGATVSITPKTAASTGMGGTPVSPMTYTTPATGLVSTMVNSQATTPFRIVATQGTTTARIAGGMNALIIH